MGQEMTVQLSMFEYTNKNGETLYIPEMPDLNAAIKYVTDNSTWDSGDQKADIETNFYYNEAFKEYLKNQFDIPDMSTQGRWNISSRPLFSPNYFEIYTLEWKGGVLVIGRHVKADSTVEFFPLYLGFTYDEYSEAFAFSPYLEQLAQEHTQ
jgi:hypothetical protein